jgi:hypothetical protein
MFNFSPFDSLRLTKRPSEAKASVFVALGGTAKAVPFPNLFSPK